MTNKNIIKRRFLENNKILCKLKLENFFILMKFGVAITVKKTPQYLTIFKFCSILKRRAVE